MSNELSKKLQRNYLNLKKKHIEFHLAKQYKIIIMVLFSFQIIYIVYVYVINLYNLKFFIMPREVSNGLCCTNCWVVHIFFINIFNSFQKFPLKNSLIVNHFFFFYECVHFPQQLFANHNYFSKKILYTL